MKLIIKTSHAEPDMPEPSSFRPEAGPEAPVAAYPSKVFEVLRRCPKHRDSRAIGRPSIDGLSQNLSVALWASLGQAKGGSTRGPFTVWDRLPFETGTFRGDRLPMKRFRVERRREQLLRSRLESAQWELPLESKPEAPGRPDESPPLVDNTYTRLLFAHSLNQIRSSAQASGRSLTQLPTPHRSVFWVQRARVPASGKRRLRKLTRQSSLLSSSCTTDGELDLPCEHSVPHTQHQCGLSAFAPVAAIAEEKAEGPSR